jgi:hypothetical protein
MGLAACVLLSRMASDWAALFDRKPEECLCTFGRDHRQFFTDEELALLDLGIGRPCVCTEDQDECDEVLDDLEEIYFSRSGLEVTRDVRERFARLLAGLRDRVSSRFRDVTDVVYSRASNQLLSRLPWIVETAIAIYPVYANFGSTCDPDVVEINCAEYLVVRARRPVKKGKVVTRASIATYLRENLVQRLDLSQACDNWCSGCRPCYEDWPMEEELTTRAEKGNVLISCPKCGSSLGMQKKVLREDLSPSAVCGKNGCDELISNIREMFGKLRNAAQKPTAQLSLPKSVKEGEEDLAEALQLVTEARKLFPSPCIYVSQLEHMADVLFLRLGNARPRSSEEPGKDEFVYRAPCDLADKTEFLDDDADLPPGVTVVRQ